MRPPPRGAKLEHFSSVTVTLREVRDFLTVACFEDIIDEDEILLLWDLNASKNLDFPYEDYSRFDLDEMDDSECLAELRFQKRYLPDLAAAVSCMLTTISYM